jgi:hypothetical protein
METSMSVEEVMSLIKQLHNDGSPLNKKKVKKSHPTLMQSALYYYPSWEHALQETGLELQ